MRRACANCGRLQKHLFVIVATSDRVYPRPPKAEHLFCSKSCYCEYEQHDRTPWRKPCAHCR